MLTKSLLVSTKHPRFLFDCVKLSRFNATSINHQFLQNQKKQNPPIPVVPVRYFTKSSSLGIFGQSDDSTTVFQRIKKSFGFTDTPKHKLLLSGYEIYIKIADELNYASFFQLCNMEDTFNSWFTVVEVHIWLLAARLMEEGEEGKIVRNSMIRAMWEDTDARSKKLEGALNVARKDQIRELNEQFQAALLGYDEGIQTNDKVLTGALWRRFFRSKEPENDEELLKQIEALELLVIYLRSQLFKLSEISKDQVLFKKDFKFDNFDQNLLQVAQNYKMRQ